jgi:hypothetical protein
MPQQNAVPVTLQLARWLLRDWMKDQVAKAGDRLAPVYRGHAAHFWRNGRNAEMLAAEIKNDTRWLLVQASWQLSTPTDQQVLELASFFIGGVRGDEVQLLADAIIIAGAPKNSPQRGRAEQRAAITLGGIAARSVIYGL